jgi:hypothetical protein
VKRSSPEGGEGVTRKAEYGFAEKEDMDGRTCNCRVLSMKKIPNSGLDPFPDFWPKRLNLTAAGSGHRTFYDAGRRHKYAIMRD